MSKTTPPTLRDAVKRAAAFARKAQLAAPNAQEARWVAEELEAALASPESQWQELVAALNATLTAHEAALPLSTKQPSWKDGARWAFTKMRQALPAPPSSASAAPKGTRE